MPDKSENTPDTAPSSEPGGAPSQTQFEQALALHQAGRLAEAEEIYLDILKAEPTQSDALHLLGVIAYQSRNHERAVALMDQAIALTPHNPLYYCNRGNALRELKQPDAAVASFDTALALKPDYAEAYYNRGNALRDLKQLDAAVASYDKALTLKPDYAEAYANRGVVRQELKQLETAIADYDKAIQFKPDYAEAYENRGHALQELQDLDAAVASYAQALQLKPDSEFLFGAWLNAKTQLCDWTGYDEGLQTLTARIEAGERVTPSFPVLALLESPRVQRLSAELWAQAHAPPRDDLGPFPQRPRGEKIRIGYFSADFREHAVSYLAADLFETHDRSKFDVVGFSFSAQPEDDMRRRVSAAFDNFLDVSLKTDKDIALLSRELGLDIAIDLGGHTHDARPGIFSYRAAPLQVSYLGYLGTMGAPYFDYLIADKTLILEDAQTHYSEKIAYLPSYQINDSQRPIAAKIFTRDELGLPDEGFVFCCFSVSHKISPRTFQSWMRILKAVEGSVLWLLEQNATAVENLYTEAEKNGVSRGRLIFGKLLPRADYLARFRTSDLFLDTLPYNAGTTASDALWAGLPVLTQRGASFAGRVAGSVLTAIELPELIAESQEDYEAKAINLATEARALAEIKRKLAHNRLTTPLFNCKKTTQHIEAAYTAMYERYFADLAPAHLEISDSGL